MKKLIEVRCVIKTDKSPASNSNINWASKLLGIVILYQENIEWQLLCVI